ncbi:hypothetical protein D3C78_668100 [compost metagenome]
MEVFAVAGPVLDHAGLAVEGFPTVMAGQAQGIAVACHYAVCVAEAAHGVAVAVDHRAELAVFVVAVLSQGFDRFVVHHPLDVGQPAQRVVVVQVHAGAAGGADVGQRAFGGASEVQEVAEGVFDALQRHVGVGVWHFTEVEEQVVEGLQDVVAALGAHQVHLLVRVVDAFARLQRDERDFAALVVGEVDEAALAAQALFPRQYPAAAEHAVDRQVAGVEARPLDGHQAGQAEVDFVGDEFAAGGQVYRVTGQGAHGPLRYRFNYVAAGDFAGDKACGELQGAGHDGFHAGLGAGLDQLGDTAGGTGNGHQHVYGRAQPFGDFVVHRQIAECTPADDDVVRAAGDGRAAGQLVALAGRRHAVDEDVGRAFGDLYGPWVLVTGTDAFLDPRGLAAVDEDVG